MLNDDCHWVSTHLQSINIIIIIIISFPNDMHFEPNYIGQVGIKQCTERGKPQAL